MFEIVKKRNLLEIWVGIVVMRSGLVRNRPHDNAGVIFVSVN